MRTLLFVAIIIAITITFRRLCRQEPCPKCQCDYSNYKEQIDQLNKIINADKNIFDYIRCINVPQTPSCVTKNNNDVVCKSRQIDCNKFKLVLLNDPVAVERMKIATDLYTETDKPKNPSDLTYPVRSGWFY